MVVFSGEVRTHYVTYTPACGLSRVSAAHAVEYTGGD